jgi:hypothetical protein
MEEPIMKRPILGVTTLTAALLVGMSAHPAGAAGTAADTTDGKAALDALCRDKGGQPYFTPYTISRCQGARSKQGFEVEAAICEDLGGSFSVADSQTRRNRSNWACVSGSIAP